MNILVLTPYAPWPAYGGGTMRIYQLLRGIAKGNNVTCLTFVPDETATAGLSAAVPAVTWHTVVGPRRRPTWQRAFDTLFHPWPDMALRNHDHGFYVRLHELCAATQYDLVVGFSIEMVPYLGIAKSYGYATHFDTFNAEYVIQQRAFLTDIRRPQRWHAALYSLLQWYKLWRYERRTVRAVDGVSVVSAGDATMLQSFAPQTPLTVVPNGVDSQYFDRAKVVRGQDQAPTIAFSGTLDYRANVDAMVWFCADVLPKVRAVIPAAQCVVIGRRPAPELKALATRGEITLTGEVEDTRPFLCGAAVYVVPMRIGGGARLKVLEAMALELPIVSTQMGAEGIDGVPAGVIQIADDAELFAQAVITALQQQVVVPAARAFVQGSYDWRVIMPTWNSALQNTIQHAAQ